VLAFSCRAFSGEIYDAARSGDSGIRFRNCSTKTPASSPAETIFPGQPCYVAVHGHRGVAQLLLAKKAEVDARDGFGGTPLHVAAVNGNRDVAELLLAGKADVNATTNRGPAPLSLALDKDHEEVAELLRLHGGEEARSEPTDSV